MFVSTCPNISHPTRQPKHTYFLDKNTLQKYVALVKKSIMYRIFVPVFSYARARMVYTSDMKNPGQCQL